MISSVPLPLNPPAKVVPLVMLRVLLPGATLIMLAIELTVIANVVPLYKVTVPLLNADAFEPVRVPAMTVVPPV